MANNKEITIQDIDFSEDLPAFDHHGRMTETLYGECHDIFKRVSGGSSGVMGMSSTTSIAEMGKTLASIRSTAIDLTNKKFQAKKSLVEMRMKQAQLENGDIIGSDDQTMARNIVREVLNAKMGKTPQANAEAADISRKLLDQRLETEMNQGNIILTANERAMKYDFNQVVEYAYKQDTKEIVAIHKETKQLIPDYPKDRIPRTRVTKVEGEQAITTNGLNLPLYKA